MSGGLRLVFERQLPGVEADLQSFGALVMHAGHISEIARLNRLKDLFSFVHVDAAQLEKMMSNFVVAGLEAPAEAWFEADEGLAWVAGLRSCLGTTEFGLEGEARTMVEGELDQFAAVLRTAKQEGLRWHLEVSAELPALSGGEAGGVDIFVVLDDDQAAIDVEMNGHALGEAADQIGAIAEAAGLAAPLSFVSTSAEELAELIGFLGEDQALPEETWWTAEEGLQWLKALRTALAPHTARLPAWQEVQADLTRLEEILQQAHPLGLRWHLALDV